MKFDGTTMLEGSVAIARKVFDVAELAFAHHVHDLNARDQDSGAAEGLEAEHLAG